MSKRKAINEAAHWAVRMRSGDVGAEENSRFESWLGENSENSHEYDKLSFLDEAAFAFADLPEARAMLASDLEDYAPPNEKRWWQRIPTSLISSKWAAAAVAAGVVLMVTIVNIPQPVPPSMATIELSVQTETGGYSKHNLPDGSTIDLNTRTQLQVLMDGDRRQVIMDRGEAFFSVAHDAERPFVVNTSDGTITVLGTRFNVRQEAERMIVSVIEGRVEVVPTAPRAPATTLVRGEQLFLDRGTDSSVERRTDFERITAWRQQKLMFDGASLIDAVQEINRYIDGGIEIADPGLEGVRISGVFRAGDSEGFISALDNLVGVNAVTGSDEVIRLYAAGEQKQ